MSEFVDFIKIALGMSCLILWLSYLGERYDVREKQRKEAEGGEL